MTTQSQTVKWIPLCQCDDLVAESGVAARLGDQQLALFYLPQENAVYAIDNYDPFSQANVLARGLVADIDGNWVVASPIYKQHFRLLDGQCLEEPQLCLKTWSVRLNNERVEIALQQ